MAQRVLVALLAAVAAAAPARAHESPPGDGSGPPPVALWVLAEGAQRVLERPERIPALMEDARALGATDLFVQVYRRGVAWWPSDHARPADAWAAWRAAHPDAPDPLTRLLDAARAEGLRVHAWINLLSLADNAGAAVLAALGPETLQVDRKGRSILDYPEGEMPAPEAPHLRMGTPAVWLDPAAPGVATWYAALVSELFQRHPGLAGLHLDYVRYPDVLPFAPGSGFGVGMDFGYGEATRRRFREETGLEAPFGDRRENARAWDGWRRGQLTALVRALRAALHGAAPEARLSAAVIPYAERAYLSLYQDWLGWVETGLVDVAVPMLYTRDERMLGYQAAAYASLPGRARIWTGLGVWLFDDDPPAAVAQLRRVRALGAGGLALFSWDSIAVAPALRAALAAEAARVARR